jgi:hypothetical protein
MGPERKLDLNHLPIGDGLTWTLKRCHMGDLYETEAKNFEVSNLAGKEMQTGGSNIRIQEESNRIQEQGISSHLPTTVKSKNTTGSVDVEVVVVVMVGR